MGSIVENESWEPEKSSPLSVILHDTPHRCVNSTLIDNSDKISEMC